MKAIQLRQALQAVAGVREVGLRPGEQPGTGRILVVAAGRVPVDALVAAARALRVELRVAEAARPGVGLQRPDCAR